VIISASRRTDIPTYYSDWFFQRIKESYVLVRNPMNIHQVSKICLSPEVVDGIVFWTKNPIPMIERLDEISQYPYYFQFTLNAYGKDVEPNVPSKNEVIIPAFQKLSQKIGRNRVVWRYDPIFINEKYTLEYHCKYFESLASKLHMFTERCTISFIDYYRNTERNMKPLDLISISIQQKVELMERFSSITTRYGLPLDTCAEAIDLQKFGIMHANCIDKERLEKIGGYTLNVEKDKNQRMECACISSIDIGMYNTCKNGCLYCYANYSNKIVQNNCGQHRSDSPLICGEIIEGDILREREVKSCKNCQVSLLQDQ
jgi:hypothetical protein